MRLEDVAYCGFLTGAILVAGCGYPKVSAETYELSKALYSITNLQADDRLDKIELKVSESLKAERISNREARWLNDIIADAKSGQWKKATAAARRIMEDQATPAT